MFLTNGHAANYLLRLQRSGLWFRILHGLVQQWDRALTTQPGGRGAGARSQHPEMGARGPHTQQAFLLGPHTGPSSAPAFYREDVNSPEMPRVLLGALLGAELEYKRNFNKQGFHPSREEPFPAPRGSEALGCGWRYTCAHLEISHREGNPQIIFGAS